MAHNINSMFYVKQEPWHGLGTKVEKELNAAEAIKAAGLDWTVSKHPILHPITGAKTGYNTIMRDDTQDIFAAGVSNSFRPFQNSEAFKLADDICATKEAKFHTAGALGKGEKVWMLCKMPKDIKIKGTGDVTEQFLLISNGHDGAGALKVLLTPIRVVCQNTLNAALGAAKAKDVYTVIHYGDNSPRIEKAREILQLASKRFTEAGDIYNMLAAKVMQKAQVEAILNALIPLRNDGDEEDQVFRVKHHENIKNLFEDNDGNAFPKIAGTGWAFYNAVTRYVDFYKNPFGNVEKVAPMENRLSSVLFGADALLKRKALDLTYSRLYANSRATR